MTNLLRINASSTLEYSNSADIASAYQQKLLQSTPQASITEVNLIEQALPHLTPQHIAAMYSESLSETQQQLLEQSDEFINQLKDADTLLIATSMYNFGIPSQLKAYFDLVCRVGKTFNYTEQGPKGLLTEVKAILVIASGGDYTQPPYNEMDHVTPYLKTVLNFIGITQIEVINAPNMSREGELKESSKQQAIEQIEKLL